MSGTTLHAALMDHRHDLITGGIGYPAGLPGKGILPEAQIIAAADVVEAMSSHRPCIAALGINKTLEEI